ncbi:hypothetical protein DID80_04315 [Candidatus Marinamargulisbacteria bacterium SCGC AAA071-K20]|nr:hypothetical protein DID80_04315 [Candidatus Marinamargulisbacteria bacterium SCGC AAA071-K20]
MYYDNSSYTVNHYYNYSNAGNTNIYQSYDEYIKDEVVIYTDKYSDTWTITGGSYSGELKKGNDVISSYSGSSTENGDSFANTTPSYSSYGTSTYQRNTSGNTMTYLMDLTVEYKTGGVTYATLRFPNATQTVDLTTFETLSIIYPLTITISLDDGVKYTQVLYLSV